MPPERVLGFCQPVLFGATLLLSATVWGAPGSDTYREVTVKVEPKQSLKAIAIRSGDDVVPIEIRGGKALIPSNLALPWTVSVSRFEATIYTQIDLEQRRPLLIRKLGVIRGVLRRDKAVKDQQFTFLLWRGGPNRAEKIPFAVDATGAFDISLPAGIYQGAVLGEASGTRIRSAIVVDPGQKTDIRDLIVEPTAHVSVRVVDSKRRTPIRGAAVEWAPPTAANSEVAKVLYADSWSTVTDTHGMAVFRSIGPPTIPLRWRVSVTDYAAETTRPFELRDSQSVSLSVALRDRALIVVRVRLPRKDSAELRDAKLILEDPDEANPLRFVPVTDAKLQEGEVKFVSTTYGRKRLAVANAAGRKLLYHDFDTIDETTFVDLTPVPVDIHGNVKRNGGPVDGALVRLADEHDATTVLALAKTDSDGYYRLTTFQSGHVSLYAVESNQPGMQSYPLKRNLELLNGNADYQIDFDLPDSGAVIRVVDATTGDPLQAVVDKRLTYSDGTSQMGITKTDKDGRLVLSGFPNGKAHLYIRASGHYAREVDVPLTDGSTETLIKLDGSRSISGRIVDLNGTPISGARITGGYRDELAPQAPFEAITDGMGHFLFDFAPEPGTTFYVEAAGYRLGITTLQTDQENTLTLFPPGRGGVFLMPGNAPPTKLYLVMAAPVGSDYIPLGALRELAAANGLSTYQLLAASKDGSVALPEFLPAGNYNFYIALKDGKSWIYHKVGTVSLPADENSVLAFSEN